MKKFIIFLAMCFLIPSVNAETVVYNTSSGKYHKPTCQFAKKCTKNCIKIDKKQAKAKGGVPCKSCGG